MLVTGLSPEIVSLHIIQVEDHVHYPPSPFWSEEPLALVY